MADLDKIIHEEEKKIATKFNLFVGFPMTIAGEGMQLATKAGLMDYNWATGHLSDFGIVFQTSALMYNVTSKFSKYIRTAASLLPPIIATIHEYYPMWNGENVTDHTDTALFWLGWAASMAGIKYLASRKAKREAAQEYGLRTPAPY